MSNLNQYFSPAQIERANQMAAQSIGKHFKVRENDGSVQHGKIVDCSPAYAGGTARTVSLVFSIDMLCGVNERRRQFHVTRLPY